MQSLAGVMPYIHIILSIFLMAGIIMQQSDASLGAVFGDTGDAGSGSRTRRGFEKTIFDTTKVLSVLFVISIVASLLI
jgi:protein translocase SecG subunit